MASGNSLLQNPDGDYQENDQNGSTGSSARKRRAQKSNDGPKKGGNKKAKTSGTAGPSLGAASPATVPGPAMMAAPMMAPPGPGAPAFMMPPPAAPAAAAPAVHVAPAPMSSAPAPAVHTAPAAISSAPTAVVAPAHQPVIYGPPPMTQLERNQAWERAMDARRKRKARRQNNPNRVDDPENSDDEREPTPEQKRADKIARWDVDSDGFNDRTSWRADQSHWNMDNFPEILYAFEQQDHHIIGGQRPTERKRIHGRNLVVFPNLPDNISSKVEEFRVEAWLRSDNRITLKDITLRMHKWFRIGTNTLQMRGLRFRKDCGLVAWNSGNTKTDEFKTAMKKTLELNNIDPLLNTTRGITVGLMRPELGEDGGRIGVPPKYVKSWSRPWILPRRPVPLIQNGNGLNAIPPAFPPQNNVPASQGNNGGGGTGGLAQPYVQQGNAPSGTVAPYHIQSNDDDDEYDEYDEYDDRDDDGADDEDDNGSHISTNTDGLDTPIYNGDDWLGLGLESDTDDEGTDTRDNRSRQANMTQEEIDTLFAPENIQDQHAREFAAQFGIELDAADAPSIQDAEAEQEAENLERLLEDFIKKQRERGAPLRNMNELPYLRSVLFFLE